MSREKRSKGANWSDYNSACRGIHGAQVRLGQKNVPHSPRLSGEQIRGIPNICLGLPCSGLRRVGVGSSAVDGVFYFHAFSPPSSCYCRSALTSRPCHGSMLAFLFPASRDGIQHNSEARVPFGRADWSSPAEARPKRSAVIGRRSINSDCHVLIKGAEHNVAL